MSASELHELRRQWQDTASSVSDGDMAAAVRRRVVRETRASRVALLAPVLVTLLIGGGVVARAAQSRSAVDLVLAAETWVFIVVTWMGALWIARGTWRPLADTTAAFVAVSIRRRESHLRASTFAAWLYALQLSFVVGLSIVATPATAGAVLTAPAVVLLGWLGVPVAVVALRRFRRRQREQLERLRELERQLEAERDA